MEPRIQYAQTKDGVSIAFCAHGKGTPLVQIWNPLGHIRQQWGITEFRAFYERLAEKRMLVQYDIRGTGLSQRDVTDFSLEALTRDTEAVVDRLELERFALWGNVTMGPAAIAYAARHPERVSQLILWCSYARGSDFLKSPQAQVLVRLIDNWELYTETLAHYAYGFGGGEAARLYAETIREGVTQETFRAFQDQISTVDVTDLLSQLMPPTLVLHRRQFGLVSVDVATGLASSIPNARLVLLEGDSSGYHVDSEAVLDAFDEFLGEGDKPTTLAAGNVHTILFTDVEGSTVLTQRLGDAKARELLREHERIVREALKAHGGLEVKTMGDGFMASFSSVTKALECAIAMQRAFDEWNQDVGAQGLAPLRVRIGLNAGEPIAEADPDGRSDLFGTAVTEAARITATAKGGEILVSDVVRQLAKGKGFLFADRGEANLKGFDEPVRLYEVRWREEGQ